MWEDKIIVEMARYKVGRTLRKAEKKRRMKKSGCPTILDDPTVI